MGPSAGRREERRGEASPGQAERREGRGGEALIQLDSFDELAAADGARPAAERRDAQPAIAVAAGVQAVVGVAGSDPAWGCGGGGCTQ